MNIEETKEAIRVMQAFVDGKKIDCKRKDDTVWEGGEIDPGWHWNTCDYRIKPEPHYRPFKTAEEVMEAIKEYGDWARYRNEGFYKITYFSDTYVQLSDTMPDSYIDAFEKYTFANGTPFGVMEE